MQNEFLAHHMPLQHFIQHRDLQETKENWETKIFIQIFPENSVYTNEYLMIKYLERVVESHTKTFRQWKDNYIYLLLACDDVLPNILITSWLLGVPIQEEHPLTF